MDNLLEYDAFSLNESDLKVLKDEFDVRDALGGELSGEYDQDIKRLNKKGLTTDKKTYNLAYQNQEQA